MTPAQLEKLREYAEAFAGAVNGRRKLAALAAQSRDWSEYEKAAAMQHDAAYACAFALAGAFLGEWLSEPAP